MPVRLAWTIPLPVGAMTHMDNQPTFWTCYKITAGGNATCGISTTGYPYCWGDGYSSDEWGATTYPSSDYAADISVYGSFGCIIGSFKEVKCWGPDSEGLYLSAH